MEFKLLVDAGNTRVKTALMDAEGHLEPLFNVSYSDLPKQQIEHSLKGIWLAEVSGTERAQQVEAWLSQFAAPITTIQSEQAAFGVENAYETPQHLGVDRWLALIGAYNEVPKATLIIDAGTAITVDWLNAEGKHLGGWIVPGVDLMKQAVTARAPKVFSDADTDWGKAQQVGRSTPECLGNGCVNAFVGVIRQALAVSETELDWFDFRVLFSGGSTPLLPADLKRRGELRTELVLQGLSYYAKTN